MASQHAILYGAAVQGEAKMWAAVVECKNLTAIMDDEQRAAGAADDDHTRYLQLLQRADTNEIIGPRGRIFIDLKFRHEGHYPSLQSAHDCNHDRIAGTLHRGALLATLAGVPYRNAVSRQANKEGRGAVSVAKG